MSTPAARAASAAHPQPTLADRLDDCYSRQRLLFLVVGCFVLLWLRKPDALVYPQFVAEDGVIFFREQLLYGARVILRPFAGYVCLLPRLIALVCSPLPVYWIPFGYAVLGGLVQSAATAFLFVPSNRYLLRSDALRALVCLLMVALGPSELLLLNAVNVQWPLFGAGVLLLARALRRSDLGFWRTAIDAATALLIGLTTSLLVLVTLPVATWALFRRRSGSRLLVSVFLLTAAAQLTTFALTGSAQPAAAAQRAEPLHLYVVHVVYASMASYVYRVVVATVAGEPAAAALAGPMAAVVASVFPVLLAGLAWLSWRCDRRRRLAIAAGLAISALSIAVPMAVRGLLQYFGDWNGPFILFGAGRYFVLPVGVFVWLIALGVERAFPRGWVKHALLVAVCAGGLIGNFKVAPYARAGWRKQARRVEVWRAEYAGGRRPDPLLVRTAPEGWFFILE